MWRLLTGSMTASAANHGQEHLERLRGVEGMGHVRRHEHGFPCPCLHELSTDGTLRPSVQHLDESVKGCGVLAQTLSLVKAEQRYRSYGALDQRAAHNRAGYVGKQFIETQRFRLRQRAVRTFTEAEDRRLRPCDRLRLSL